MKYSCPLTPKKLLKLTTSSQEKNVLDNTTANPECETQHEDQPNFFDK